MRYVLSPIFNILQLVLAYHNFQSLNLVITYYVQSSLLDIAIDSNTLNLISLITLLLLVEPFESLNYCQRFAFTFDFVHIMDYQC